MPLNPRTVEYALEDLLERLWALEVARETVARLEAAGEEVTRPLPEEQLFETLEILEEEFETTQNRLIDIREEYPLYPAREPHQK